MFWGIMTDIQSRSIRQKAIERHNERLKRRIMSMEMMSRRFSWIRLAVVLVGGVVTWFAGTFANARWGWLTFIVAFILFVIVVICHRRLESWIAKFKKRSAICADRLARMTLDWDHIPEKAFSGKDRSTSLKLDLDLTGRRSLHTLLNTSISRQGSLLLEEWLSEAVPNLDEIQKRQGVVKELVKLPRFRDRLELNFRLASKEQLEANKLLQWLEEEVPSRRLAWALPVAILLAATDLVLFVLNNTGKLPAIWFVSLLLYAAFYFFNIGAIGEFLESIVQLDTELGKFQVILHFLETYPYRNNANLRQLCRPFHEPDHLPSVKLRKLRVITVAIGLRSNLVFGLLLNLVFPWDLFFASLAIRSRDEVSRYLPLWLDVLHQVEGLIALANFAFLNPDYSFPEIHLDIHPVFQAEGLGHPLIPGESRVSNDFEVPISGQLYIITGSNMAGKSTFIKTIGINLCLAYAGSPVCARRLRMIPFRLDSCIHITDSVTDGFSYFYAEVKCLKRVLDDLKKENSDPLLYLIDEIFRGTNNRERLIGSRAYVKAAVGGNGVGFLATHDLELASLAETSSGIGNYHFCDFVQDGRLAFDYKIRPGPSPTTNALKIMEMEGLPFENSSTSHSENKNGPRQEPGASGTEPGG
jgi:ABC-type multidrug transport system fused ATPase/permease subunit